jgi:hypothetical protein
LRELVFDDVPGTASGGLQVIAYGGTVNAMVYDNRVTGLPQSLNSGLIGLGAHGGTLNASAFYNHVRSTSGSAYQAAASSSTLPAAAPPAPSSCMRTKHSAVSTAAASIFPKACFRARR